ncbi:hypothetical protein HRI_005169700 [Hibiscus trionum]|uniref:Uncharacterized protein n=1 Tax=Hibiscus trionum TaxID=183268 RepID=A0A9W7JIA8_HIBTR|nr:hypothetical protein HRI_005169700 [Hibiscus trionum]
MFTAFLDVAFRKKKKKKKKKKKTKRRNWSPDLCCLGITIVLPCIAFFMLFLSSSDGIAGFKKWILFAVLARVRTYLLEGFIRHTHIASWHTLHNVIFGTAGKLDRYLDVIRDRLDCDVNVFHGKDDEVIPLECSYNVQRRIPRARVKVVENKDHITIVVGRQKAFARELEEIWKKSTGN